MYMYNVYMYALGVQAKDESLNTFTTILMTWKKLFILPQPLAWKLV